MSYLISLSNYEETTVDYNIFKSEATHMTSGTGNSRSGTAIYLETAEYPVTQPVE